MPKTANVAGGFDPVSVAYVVLVFVVIFAPVLFRRWRPSAGHGDTSSEGGGGGGPTRSPEPPALPGGGIPLTDAEQSAARLRDHVGPNPASPPGRRRRPAHAPERERRRIPVH